MPTNTLSPSSLPHWHRHLLLQPRRPVTSDNHHVKGIKIWHKIYLWSNQQRWEIFNDFCFVLEIVQILQTAQVATVLPRSGCKISALLGTILHLLILTAPLNGIWRWSISFPKYLFAGGARVESSILLSLDVPRNQLLDQLPWPNLRHSVLLRTCTWRGSLHYVYTEMWFEKWASMVSEPENDVMDSNLQRRFSMWLPCHPPSCSARCLHLSHLSFI